MTFNTLKQTIKDIRLGMITYRLNEWEVPKNKLVKLVGESFTKDRMRNNIVDLNQNDVKSILEMIY